MANRSKSHRFKNRFSRKRKQFLVERGAARRREKLLAKESGSSGALNAASPCDSGDVMRCNETKGPSEVSNGNFQVPCVEMKSETTGAIYVKIEVEASFEDDIGDVQLPSKNKLKRKKQPEKDVASELRDATQTGTCRCCLSQVSFKTLQYGNTSGELTDTYVDMLLTTFGITMTRVQEHSVNTLALICSECKARLQNAFAFKQQILKADKDFLELIGNGSFDVDSAKKVNDVAKKSKKIKEENTFGSEYLTAMNVRKDSDIQGVSTSKNQPTARGVKRKHKKKPAAIQKSVATEQKTVPAGIKCDVCYKMEDNCVMLSYHMKRDHHQCHKCSEMFRNKYEKVEHERTHPLECELCKEKFETDPLLRSHMVHEHRVKKFFTCPICKTICDSRAKWHQHRIKVHGAHEWKCGACDRLFFARNLLSEHHRAHHMMERNFPCTKCDYKGINAYRLNRHMICHSDVKSFQCQYCEKKFARTNTLRFHERIHTGDKRQVCKLCGTAFVQRASLKYHLEKQHPGQF